MALSNRVPDLTGLQLLLAVAKGGSLSQAARELEITQPAASARIRTMEQLIGVALLERSPNGSRLTPGGVLLADWARPVLEAAESLDAGIDALRTRRNTRLRVSASLTIAEYLLPAWLLSLRNQRPDTVVSLTAGNSKAVADQVLASQADLGFVEGTTLPVGLRGVPIGNDRLVVVVSRNHPWAKRRSPVPAEELAETSLIIREEGSGTREVLARALAKHGGPAAPLLEMASTTALKATAISGAGPAVLSALAVTDELASHRLVSIPLQDVDLSRTFKAIWPAGHRPAGPSRDLLSITRMR
ncbi:LysR family transcriptional regulator [Streptomyces klenkii]|uniref:LysR family transcriptional regulator n=1 Tax=Streptomyces klenkii TaxID=1420899 RepID=UPI0033A80C43